jgi:hypothetical protein
MSFDVLLSSYLRRLRGGVGWQVTSSSFIIIQEKWQTGGRLEGRWNGRTPRPRGMSSDVCTSLLGSPCGLVGMMSQVHFFERVPAGTSSYGILSLG